MPNASYPETNLNAGVSVDTVETHGHVARSWAAEPMAIVHQIKHARTQLASIHVCTTTNVHHEQSVEHKAMPPFADAQQDWLVIHLLSVDQKYNMSAPLTLTVHLDWHVLIIDAPIRAQHWSPVRDHHAAM